MEEKKINKFMKTETRKGIIVFSVILFLLIFVDLFLLAFYGYDIALDTAFFDIIFNSASFIIALLTMLASFIIYGAYLIRVFYDYKKQNKWLVIDGTIFISIVVLMALLVILVALTAVTGSTNALFIYPALFAFLGGWQILMTVRNAQIKNPGWVFNLINAILTLSFTALITIMITKTLSGDFSDTGTLFTLTNLVMDMLVISFGVNLLYSYVFNHPTYLETDEGLMMLKQDEEKKLAQQRRMQQFRENLASGAPFGETYVAPAPAPAAQPVAKGQESIEDKLAKLDNLFKKNLITEDEYKQKKSKLLEEL